MARTRRELEGPPERVAAVLRERIYGGIACLSTLLVLLRPGTEATGWQVFFDVVVATGGLWAASLLADWVAHLAAHGGSGRWWWRRWSAWVRSSSCSRRCRTDLELEVHVGWTSVFCLLTTHHRPFSRTST